MKMLAALGLTLLAGTASAAETIRYVALVNGGTTHAGHERVTHGDAGKITSNMRHGDDA